MPSLCGLIGAVALASFAFSLLLSWSAQISAGRLRRARCDPWAATIHPHDVTRSHLLAATANESRLVLHLSCCKLLLQEKVVGMALSGGHSLSIADDESRVLAGKERVKAIPSSSLQVDRGTKVHEGQTGGPALVRSCRGLLRRVQYALPPLTRGCRERREQEKRADAVEHKVLGAPARGWPRVRVLAALWVLATVMACRACGQPNNEAAVASVRMARCTQLLMEGADPPTSQRGHVAAHKVLHELCSPVKGPPASVRQDTAPSRMHGPAPQPYNVQGTCACTTPCTGSTTLVEPS